MSDGETTSPREEGDAIPLLAPGETAGPFEIQIPREAMFYFYWLHRTTRWERTRIRLHLMRRARRREVYLRMADLLGIDVDD